MSQKRRVRSKVSRTLGEDLSLFSGVRDYETKIRQSHAPGQHGKSPKKSSDYGVRLKEKQKVKFMFGIRTERQFRNYFKEASRLAGEKGVNLLRLLETRLDNVAYRLGFGSTRAAARQLVSHGAILVNDRAINLPSYQAKVGDIIRLKDKAILKEKETQGLRFQSAMALNQSRQVPWVESNDKFEGTVLKMPERSEMSQSINEALIVELYSK